MDSPLIKDIFPVVKKEFVGLGVEDSPTKPFKKSCMSSPENSYLTNDVEDTSVLYEPLIKHFPTVTSAQLDEEYKLELLCLDDEVIEAIEPKPIIEFDVKSNDSEPQFIGNKIIMGSRPAQFSRETESKKQIHDAKMQKCLNVKVVIDDSSVMLKKSKSFCFDCKTLFPNVKAYNSHKRTVHSCQQVDKKDDNETDQRSGNSLFVGNKFKCGICIYSVTRLYYLRRHYISKHQFEMPEELASEYKKSKLPKNKATTANKTSNIRKKPPRSRNKVNVCNLCCNTATNSDKTKNIRKRTLSSTCNHCRINFSKKDELISHLYDMLKQKTFQCPECLLKFDDQEQMDKHLFEHIEVGNEAVVEISQTKDSTAVEDVEKNETSEIKKSGDIDIDYDMSVDIDISDEKVIPVDGIYGEDDLFSYILKYEKGGSKESSSELSSDADPLFHALNMLEY